MKKSEVTRKFITWLDSWLDQANVGDKLLSIKELSANYYISEKTIHTILHQYAIDKKVLRIQGKGTIKITDNYTIYQQVIKSPNRLKSVDSLSNLVRNLIYSGELKHGEALPTVKYLTRRFRVSSKTTVNTLKLLEKEGHVTKVGRSYWIGSLKNQIHPSGKKRVYLFIRNEEELSNIFRGSALGHAFRKMEDVLGSSGYLLQYAFLDSLEQLVKNWHESDEYPYGCIMYGLDHTDLDRIQEPLARIAALGKRRRMPLVIDWGGTADPRLPGGAFLFPRANIGTTVARTLARFLTAKKFGAAVFFMDFRNLYRNPTGIIAFYDFIRFRTELKHVAPGFAYRLAMLEMSAEEAARPLSAYVREDFLARPLDKYEPVPASAVAAEIRYHQGAAAAFDAYAECGCWVFQRDHHAKEALDWARARKKAVPRDLSIISLESDPAYYHHGFTRCEPDWEGAGYLMAHVVVGDIPIERTSKGFVRVRARVVEKLTSR